MPISQRLGILFVIVMLVSAMLRWTANPVPRESIVARPLDFRINVNTADVPTLSLLSGISSTIASYIIEDRQTNGPFQSAQDLDRVSRIGPVTIRKIEPYVRFE